MGTNLNSHTHTHREQADIKFQRLYSGHALSNTHHINVHPFVYTELRTKTANVADVTCNV